MAGARLTALPDVTEERIRQRARERERAKRPREVMATTVSAQRIARDVRADAALYPEDTRPLRPRTRGECEGAPRPCPFVSCAHHLYLDVQPRTGAIKLNFPDLEPEQMQESCALDVADRGGTTLEAVGALMNITRERIRQIEVTAKRRVEEHEAFKAIADVA